MANTTIRKELAEPGRHCTISRLMIRFERESDAPPNKTPDALVAVVGTFNDGYPLPAVEYRVTKASKLYRLTAHLLADGFVRNAIQPGNPKIV